MKLIQITSLEGSQRKPDPTRGRIGYNGGYFQYEFGIVGERATRIDFSGDRTDYIVNTDEIIKLGEFDV